MNNKVLSYTLRNFWKTVLSILILSVVIGNLGIITETITEFGVIFIAGANGEYVPAPLGVMTDENAEEYIKYEEFVSDIKSEFLEPVFKDGKLNSMTALVVRLFNVLIVAILWVVAIFLIIKTLLSSLFLLNPEIMRVLPSNMLSILDIDLENTSNGETSSANPPTKEPLTVVKEQLPIVKIEKSTPSPEEVNIDDAILPYNNTYTATLIRV